jgi:deoxyribodipyrimidine photolyase-related protein
VSRRWLFADQLGPHFLDAGDQPVLLVESRAALGRRPLHRRRAHLLLSALRHRAAELGDQARLIQARTYTEAVEQAGEDLTVCAPTSWAARRLAQSLPQVTVLPARGFATSAEEFQAWAQRRGRRRLLLEDFYRDARQRLGILMDGAEPAGGRWNFDADNREPARRYLVLAKGGPERPDPGRVLGRRGRRRLDRLEQAQVECERKQAVGLDSVRPQHGLLLRAEGRKPARLEKAKFWSCLGS